MTIEIPEGAKVPNDYMTAAKAEAEEAPTSIQAIVDGVTYDVNTAAMSSDLELVELLAESEDEPVNLLLAIPKLIGRDAWKKWKNANRGDDGVVQLENAYEFITELFTSMGESLGNSPASHTS